MNAAEIKGSCDFSLLPLPMLSIMQKIGAGCLKLDSQISRYFQVGALMYSAPVSICQTRTVIPPHFTACCEITSLIVFEAL